MSYKFFLRRTKSMPQALRRSALNLAILTALSPAISYANPEGASVISGQVSIDNSIAGMTTIRNSPNAIIEWQKFNIDANEMTRFMQENSQSAVLNRIIGGNPSEILGQLFSNGKVLLINPNGIVFGSGSQIDTQGFIASTLNLSNQDFQKGNFYFSTNPTAGGIRNEGIIHAGDDGNIVFIAPNIENNGVLKTEGGKITLAAGQEITLGSLDNPEILYQIKAPQNTVLNLGKLLTEGGAVDIFAGSIKHSGDIRADSVQIDKKGNIQLVASNEIKLEKGSTISANTPVASEIKIVADGKTEFRGEIQAKSGFVEISGKQQLVFDGKVDLSSSDGKNNGHLLLDPKNIAVQKASGADSVTSYMTPDSITNTLDVGTNVLLQADNDIAVHDDIVADNLNSDGGNLGLIAGRSIAINAGISTDGGNLTLIANDSAANAANRDAGAAQITMSSNGFVDAGGVSITMQNTNSAGGDITLTEINAKNASTITNQSGNVTLDGEFSTNGAAVSISTTGANKDIVINQPLKTDVENSTANAGAITLNATNNIALNAPISANVFNNQANINTGNGGTISLTAGNSINGANQQINSKVNQYSTGTAGQAGAVSLTATTGSITVDKIDAGSYQNDELLTGGNLTANAQTNITLNQHKAGNSTLTSTAGNIVLNGTTTLAPNGNANFSATTGDVILKNTSARQINVTAGNDVNVSGTLKAKNTGNSITLKAKKSIVAQPSTQLTTDGGAVILNADSDTTNGGNIQFLAGAIDDKKGSIITTGGNIILGGGDCSTLITCTAPATGFVDSIEGILLNNTDLNSGNGLVYLNGQGFSTGTGVKLNSSSINSGTADTTLNGSNFVLDNSSVTATNLFVTSLTGLASANLSKLKATNTITLSNTSTGTVDGAELVLEANKLKLLSSGSTAFNLNATNNQVSTLTGILTGNVNYRNQADLILGDATEGVAVTTGTIDIATRTGNLTIAKNVSTTNATPSALKLNANEIATATQTTGNILISGTPTISVGTGGIGQLLTGSVSGSTGLTSLIGSGSGRFRYNSDEAVVNYATALTSGLYAIYREQPTITVTASASKVYDGTTFSNSGTPSSSGFVNGDTSAILTGIATYSVTPQNAKNVGTYTLNVSGNYTNPLGYGIAYQTGSLVITPATLSIVAQEKTKIYGDIEPALTYTATGLITGDVLTGNLTRVVGENVGTYEIQNNLVAGTNYAVSYQSAGFKITPAELTILAAAKNKIYGDLDPELTYTATGFKFTDSASLFTGKLKRAAGEDVGKYAITKDTLSAGNNYTLKITDGELAIMPAELTILADAKTKIYGDVEPKLTFKATGFKRQDTDSLLTNNLIRTEGEEVGKYDITGKFDALKNYNVTFTGNQLAITPAELTVLADAKTKIYGDTDPQFTFTATGFKRQDSASLLTNNLIRIEGEEVGKYDITGKFDALKNYHVTFTGNQLAITPAELTVLADAKTKIYGDTDPQFTFTATGFKRQDSASLLTNNLIRTEGEEVGKYDITGKFDALKNYNVTFTGNQLAITPAELTVLADAKTKVYGDTDPQFTFTAMGFKRQDTDSLLTNNLVRIEGEEVGKYDITGRFDALKNYHVTFTGNQLAITPAELTVLADAKTKIYGDTDPQFTFTATGFKRQDTDSLLTNNLVRIEGEEVGKYDITGKFDALKNYHVTFTGNQLAITPAELTVLADAKTKIYGDTDPQFTFTATGFKRQDSASLLTNNLIRIEGEEVGKYDITGRFDTLKNYNVTFTGNQLAITPAELTVLADAKTKIYGDTDPQFTFTATGFKRQDTDSLLTNNLVRIEGEEVGKYDITGRFDALKNYHVTLTGNQLAITPAELTVLADAKTKIYGDTDPQFTFTATGFKRQDTDSLLTNNLVRIEGEEVGKYDITGKFDALKNYNVTFTGNQLAITPAMLAIAANPKVKQEEQPDPIFDYIATGFKFSDTVGILSGALAREVGEIAGKYAIQQGSLSAPKNYTVQYTGAELLIELKTITPPVVEPPVIEPPIVQPPVVEPPVVEPPIVQPPVVEPPVVEPPIVQPPVVEPPVVEPPIVQPPVVEPPVVEPPVVEPPVVEPPVVEPPVVEPPLVQQPPVAAPPPAVTTEKITERFPDLPPEQAQKVVTEVSDGVSKGTTTVLTMTGGSANSSPQMIMDSAPPPPPPSSPSSPSTSSNSSAPSSGSSPAKSSEKSSDKRDEKSDDKDGKDKKDKKSDAVVTSNNIDSKTTTKPLGQCK